MHIFLSHSYFIKTSVKFRQNWTKEREREMYSRHMQLDLDLRSTELVQGHSLELVRFQTRLTKDRKYIQNKGFFWWIN